MLRDEPAVLNAHGIVMSPTSGSQAPQFWLFTDVLLQQFRAGGLVENC